MKDSNIASTLHTLRQELAEAAQARLQPGPAPTLLGASKGQPVEMLEAAIRAGLTEFGENRVQEAQMKWPALQQANPAVRLHLIGPLQSNKAAEAVALFDVIHTIDREKIIDAVADAMARQGRTPDLLVQVNTGEEAQKAGVSPRELGPLLRYAEAAGLTMGGLMCVPPADSNPAPHFALLQKLAAEYQLRWLSMGMSGDYPIATRFGATHVRVGTKLFGARSA